MKTLQTLPEGYEEYLSVDLERNKTYAIVINLLSVLIVLTSAVIMAFFIPISTLFENISPTGLLLRLGVLIVGVPLYIVLHELTHGIVMHMVGCEKVSYGFSGMYAYAKCTEYFSKTPYFLIAMTPVLFWGMVLGIVCAAVPSSWFWIFYILEIVNLSGAAGDLFVILRFARLPKEALIYDEGAAMKVYVKNIQE